MNLMKWFFCFSFSLFVISGTAQVQIAPEVQASTGGDAQLTPEYHLSYTLGESFVTTLEAGNYILTQGFHQYTQEPEEEVPFHIYNAFSPDGDMINDTWIIDGIEQFEQNTVMIYNRWGDKINHFENYDNQDVLWDGKNRNGQDLSGGTYFYIVEAGDNKVSGWVQLTK